jgi:hypothetical protein
MACKLEVGQHSKAPEPVLSRPVSLKGLTRACREG